VNHPALRELYRGNSGLWWLQSHTTREYSVVYRGLVGFWLDSTLMPTTVLDNLNGFFINSFF
jgi:hypothetical protein